jgi:teichoic acid transport system ATP-binding protein
MAEEYAIRVKNITKRYKLFERNRDRVRDALGLTGKKKLYKDLYALKDLSFDIKKGESVGIIGVNGAGKSTILKIITGVLTPTDGEVEINGRISALLELGAGFNPEYTGLQNVYLNGTMMGFTKDEIDKRLNSILEFADIGDFINQPVKTYSSGMFVRLAFAVAINIEPEILIVDEALSVGDKSFQNKCLSKVRELTEEKNITFLFVTHSTKVAADFCTRGVVMKKGKKVFDGDIHEAIAFYDDMISKEDAARRKKKK